MKEFIRVIKYVLFSASAGIVEIASFAALDLFTSWNYWPKYLIALILSILWGFVFNRRFTFKSDNNVPVALLQVALFYVVFTPATTILGNYLAETLLWNDYIVTGLNMALNLISKYFYDRFIVFRKTMDNVK